MSIDAHSPIKGTCSAIFRACKYVIRDSDDVLPAKDGRVARILLNFALCTHPSYENCQVRSRLKATFHLTISMRGQRATDKIQRNNYYHGSCGPSLTGKTMSAVFDFRARDPSEYQRSLSEK